jgi:hypothetical protein
MLPARAEFQELKARVAALSAGPRGTREPLLASGIPALDALLGGGVPFGSLIALEGSASAGCRSIAAALLARATGTGLGAIVDDGELYPPGLEAAGVRLDRLLIVPAHAPVTIARAVDQLLRSRTARVVVMGARPLRAAVWARLARLAQRSGAVLVVIAQRAIAELSAIATLALACRIERPLLRGRGIWGIFTGFELRAELRKHKRAGSGWTLLASGG